ncbi:MAG: transposase [Thermoanaerobaculia bacterium]
MRSTNLRTWSTSRGNRLDCEYPEGYPLHATICTRLGLSFFLDHSLARPVFELLNEQDCTLAACLMPDHLHWLLSDASRAQEAVSRFKSVSTRTSWSQGRHGKLWQRSFWDHVIRRQEDLKAVAEYIIQNPVRQGLVREAREYPFHVTRL